jgi:hypothetical protein
MAGCGRRKRYNARKYRNYNEQRSGSFHNASSYKYALIGTAAFLPQVKTHPISFGLIGGRE